MNEQTNQENVNQKTEEAARAAVEDGDDIREAVRNITLKALSEGQLDLRRMREVVQAVLRGASVGIIMKGTETKQALKEAMAGVDEALAASAEASKLAIQEAAGSIKNFSTQNLKQAIEDLRALEDMFLDTVISIAKTSNITVKDSLNSLAQHARTSGTLVGKAAAKAAGALSSQLGQNMREGVSASAESLLKAGAQISQAAAGFLDGLAEALNKTGNNKQEK
ncbi:MAG TPA: hypothetical protein ENK33_04315 [Desulfobacterales bacterium]|nr:hypothetical protein [Desulfobacterales bacterium]